MDHGIPMSNSPQMIFENCSSIALASPLIIEPNEKSAHSLTESYSILTASTTAGSRTPTRETTIVNINTASAIYTPLEKDERANNEKDPTNYNVFANGLQKSCPPIKKLEKHELVIRADSSEKCNGSLLSSRIDKFKRRCLKSILPQLDDLSSVQLETLAAKVNPGELSSNVRNYFFPCNPVLKRRHVSNDDSGELTDLSDVDEPEESLDSMKCKWAEQKVLLGSEDASVAELIENKTIILDNILSAYNTQQSCKFEDKSHKDSCARSRGLLTTDAKRSIIKINNSSVLGSQEVTCAANKCLEYYSNNNSIEKGLESYFHLISHIPKALVRTRNDRNVRSISDILEEQHRNGVYRVLARKIKEKQEKRGEDYDFEDTDLSDDDLRRRFEMSAKRKRGRPPKDYPIVNQREPIPAKVNRRHSLATSSRPSGVYDFEDLVSELYLLHKPMEMDYKEIWIPNWCVVKRKRRDLHKPCQYCDRDVTAKLAEDHHCEEYDEKRRFFAKLTKEKERQVLPEIPQFDIDAVNVDPIICSDCPPYPRRIFLSL